MAHGAITDAAPYKPAPNRMFMWTNVTPIKLTKINGPCFKSSNGGHLSPWELCKDRSMAARSPTEPPASPRGLHPYFPTGQAGPLLHVTTGGNEAHWPPRDSGGCTWAEEATPARHLPWLCKVTSKPNACRTPCGTQLSSHTGHGDTPGTCVFRTKGYHTAAGVDHLQPHTTRSRRAPQTHGVKDARQEGVPAQLPPRVPGS